MVSLCYGIYRTVANSIGISKMEFVSWRKPRGFNKSTVSVFKQQFLVVYIILFPKQHFHPRTSFPLVGSPHLKPNRPLSCWDSGGHWLVCGQLILGVWSAKLNNSWDLLWTTFERLNVTPGPVQGGRSSQTWSLFLTSPPKRMAFFLQEQNSQLPINAAHFVGVACWPWCPFQILATKQWTDGTSL